MDTFGVRLRQLSASLRLAITCLVLILAGGYAASLSHMQHHHSQKDDRDGLSMDDLVGAYSGVERVAPLLSSLRGPHGDQYAPDQAERDALIEWLESDRIGQLYDDIDAGRSGPGRDPRSTLPLVPQPSARGRGGRRGDRGTPCRSEYWDDVEKVSFSKKLDAVPVDILALSTHTHALTLPLVLVLVSGLFLLTGWGRGLRHGIVALSCVSLLLDFAAMWLARVDPAFVYLILVSGALFGLLFVVQLIAILIECWLVRRPADD